MVHMSELWSKSISYSASLNYQCKYHLIRHVKLIWPHRPKEGYRTLWAGSGPWTDLPSTQIQIQCIQCLLWPVQDMSCTQSPLCPVWNICHTRQHPLQQSRACVMCSTDLRLAEGCTRTGTQQTHGPPLPSVPDPAPTPVSPGSRLHVAQVPDCPE